jgi:hypothetical protein
VQFLVEASLYESPEESAKRVDVLVKLDQVACLPLVPQPLLVTTASFCEFFFYRKIWILVMDQSRQLMQNLLGNHCSHLLLWAVVFDRLFLS